MLRVEAASRRFPNGTEALRAVSLSVGAGDFIALLGPSGCGKSTLLRLLAGLDQPDQGAVLWAGTPGRIGYVFQDPTLLPWASAAENVRLPLRLGGMGAAESAPLVAAALARVGLDGFGPARPRELSGGMRMRVSIARALVSAPALLLLDEPFAALDEFTRHALQGDLLQVWRDAGCSIVFVTHSVYEAAFLAQRILVMSPRPGRIVDEVAGGLPDGGYLGEDWRLSPEYAALVAAVTQAVRAARA